MQRIKMSTTPARNWAIRQSMYALLLWSMYSLALPVGRRSHPVSTVLEAKDGTLLGARVADDGQWRFPIADSFPMKMAVCTRLFEDEWLEIHPGFNPVSILRAFMRNVREGRVVQGGSTIPMQLVRLERGHRPRTYTEKLIELHAAIRLVVQQPRSAILGRYLAMAPYGGNVVGLEAAAWRFFGKEATTLSWAEAATLAVLPNAPALIHPGRRRGQLLEKRNRLLRKLHDRGHLDEWSLTLALDEPLPAKPYALPNEAPELMTTLGAKRDGRIRTTLLAGLQHQVRWHLARHHQQLRRRGINHTTVLILDNTTGEVIAYAGNSPTDQPLAGGQVDIIRSARSPGSTLKPLLYACAMQEGVLWPGSLLLDIPSQYGAYRPENFYRQFRGVVPAREAIASSLNVPMVRLLRDYGVERWLLQLRRMGFSTLRQNADYYGLPLILGGGEVTLWELAQVYGRLARTLNHYLSQDSRYPVWEDVGFRVVRSPSDVGYGGPELDNAPVLRAGVIWSMFEAMRLPDRPEEAAYWEAFSSSRLIAWKTGTSFGYKDAWCIGVTPEYTLGVWVGNADGEPRAGLTGIQVAAPILFDMLDLLPATGWFAPPYDDLAREAVCAETGYPAGPHCPIDTLWAPILQARPAVCPYHIQVWLHPTEDLRVHGGCMDLAQARQVTWFVLSPVASYYYQQYMPGHRSLPPYYGPCGDEREVEPMQWVFPPLEADMALPTSQVETAQAIVFLVAHQRSDATLHWYIGDQYLGRTRVEHRIAIQPLPGTYVFSVVDERGHRLTRSLRILP